MDKELRELAADFKNAHVDLAVYAAKNQGALDKKVWGDLVVGAVNADLAMQHAFADAQAEIARLRGALEAALNETTEGNVAGILEDALQK